MWLEPSHTRSEPMFVELRMVGTGTSGPLAGEVIISHHSFLLKYVLATGIRTCHDIPPRAPRQRPVAGAFPSPARGPTAAYISPTRMLRALTMASSVAGRCGKQR